MTGMQHLLVSGVEKHCHQFNRQVHGREETQTSSHITIASDTLCYLEMDITEGKHTTNFTLETFHLVNVPSFFGGINKLLKNHTTLLKLFR